MIGGLIAGGIATALMAVSFVSMAAGEGGKHAELVAGLIFMLVVIGGAVGFGLELAAFRKGRSNSIGVWLGLIWNLVLILAVIGLVFAGLFMRDA